MSVLLERCPPGWTVVRMAELSAQKKYSFVGGPFGSNLTSADYVSEAGVPVIRGVNLDGKNCRFIDDEFVYVSEAKAQSLVQNMAYPGDLVFTQRGTLGQVAEIPLSARYPRYVVSQSQMKVAVDPGRASARYVYHYFRSPVAQQLLASRIQATGVPHINLSLLKEFPVLLPPLPEQKRIAAILDKADEIRRKRQEAIRLTEELLRSAFLEMFGDPVANPKGWEVTTVGLLCARYGGELQTGPFGSQLHASDYSDVGTPVVMPQDLVAGRICPDRAARVADAHVERLPKHRLAPGDVVFSRRGDVARFAIADNDNAGWLCGTGCLRVRLGRAPVHSAFLWAELRHPSVRHWLESEAKGTTMLNLNTQILSRLPVRVPPADLQKAYAQLASLLRSTRWQGMGVDDVDAVRLSLAKRAFAGNL